ncbi:uncharacterized protein LOC123552566 isoform X2 [Mercenaria mercenaria]|uniref:uncharacterized protein LOC123552566 isoform X2 n=1 Tax=Mercenaria mercenaria TaxID=6596 RepID=UPI00234F468E|nr:uncharacterized protein LOC123552566 isoform X2 [Mercenaria mercenaria]
MAFSLTSNMDFLKKLPAYKPFLKTVLKSQIQLLVNQLSEYGDEESVFLTASMTDGTLSHIGSKSGQEFLESNEEIKSKFLRFCIGGGIDPDRSENSNTQLPGPERHKKVNKKRTDLTKFKIPEARKEKENIQIEVTEGFSSDINVDAGINTADVDNPETLILKCETDEECLDEVNDEANDKKKEIADHKKGSSDTHDTGDTTDEASKSVHTCSEDAHDDLLVDNNFVVKIETDWESDSVVDTINMEDKNNTKHIADLSVNQKGNHLLRPSTSSGKIAAHLQPEFLCCNDDLIWEKNNLPKQKRVVKASSLWTKYTAIKAVEQCKKSKVMIAEEFGVPKSTLSTWLKNSEKIKADVEGDKIHPGTKKRRYSKFYDIEEALLAWLKIVHLQAVIPKITSVNICDKANQLAQQFGYTPETFQCSKAWVERFKTRHGFKKNFVKGDTCNGD